MTGKKIHLLINEINFKLLNMNEKKKLIKKKIQHLYELDIFINNIY